MALWSCPPGVECAVSACVCSFACVYLGFLQAVCWRRFRGGAQLGGVAKCCCGWLLIGRLRPGGGQVLTHLLPLGLLDVVPGGVLQVSLHL